MFDSRDLKGKGKARAPGKDIMGAITTTKSHQTTEAATVGEMAAAFYESLPFVSGYWFNVPQNEITHERMYPLAIDFLKAIDTTLTSSKFQKLGYVEIRWNEDEMSETFDDTLVYMYQRGTFKKYLPKIYNRGFLRCGHCGNGVVYPIKEALLSLAAEGEREPWRRLSHDRLFVRYSRH